MASSRMLVLQVRGRCADLGKSAYVHTARLKNSPAKGFKKNGDKTAVVMLKRTRQLGCVFPEMERHCWCVFICLFWSVPFCVFVSRSVMPRKGWSTMDVPSGKLQVIRGPRPRSVQWFRASAFSRAGESAEPMSRRHQAHAHWEIHS